MGQIISIEGGNRVGKTSFFNSMVDLITKLGIPVQSGREPGGTEKGEIIRREIFQKMTAGESQEKLAVLFNIARKIHIEEKIAPFFNSQPNSVFVLDRYIDSTRVYQGLEGGVSMETLRKLEREYVGNFIPNLTYILYIPDEKFASVFNDRGEDRDQINDELTPWDKSKLTVHIERQKHFFSLSKIAKNYGEKRTFQLIDASQPKKQVVASALPPLLKVLNLVSSINITLADLINALTSDKNGVMVK